MKTPLRNSPRVIVQNLGLLDAVTVQPDEDIWTEIKQFKLAMLEVVENRTKSTVFRVRESGKVFQQHNDGQITRYPDLDCYLEARQKDNLVSEYRPKAVTFTLDDYSYPLLEKTAI